MSVLDRPDWLDCTPKDILHVWKYEEVPGDLRRIVLYPIDFSQLAAAEEATQAGEKDVHIVGSKITLNGTGALIWELCDGSHSARIIVDTLARRFKLSVGQATADVRRFFERLEPHNVLDIDWSPL